MYIPFYREWHFLFWKLTLRNAFKFKLDEQSYVGPSYIIWKCAGKHSSQWDLGRVWHQLRCTPSTPLLPSTHNTPSYKEHIPPSSCRKDTHLPRSQIPAMFSGNVALGFTEPPLRRPGPPPPQGPKNATNYCGSRHWSLSFNPWQVPLGHYQDVNGCCVTQQG